MPFLADLHIHSHFSRATSGQCRPGSLAAAAARKGLSLIGTGDCTHAGWRTELAAELEETEEGIYRLKGAMGPAAGVRFAVTGEISCIYKQDGKTRKIHHVMLLPDLAAAERVSKRLEDRGVNLRSDGRPITGLDSRTLLGLVLEAEPRAVLFPAHIWTPHFSLFGANSGFDALEEAFGDLSGEITAYETGLSSDPPMNWRLSTLDRLTLVSCSDAHSPEKLGREAVEFEAELSFAGLRGALRREGGKILGTIEFFPEEGKYHYDGHRNCGVRWHPRETESAGGRCPVCGRPVTVGVLHRAEKLADRPEGHQPDGAPGFTTLVPLPEILADAFDTGPTGRRVAEACEKLLRNLGPEIELLRRGDLGEIERIAGSLAAEAIRRVRAGEIEFLPGYDGEYGRLIIFRPEDRRRLAGQAALFTALPAGRRDRSILQQTAKETSAALAVEETANNWSAGAPLSGLDEGQKTAVTAQGGPIVILAGPGSGKTRTLIQRIGYLLAKRVPPWRITAITFTHRAADEMRRRLAGAGGVAVRQVWVGTFHRFCLELLTKAAGAPPVVLDERESAALLAEVAPARKSAGRGGEAGGTDPRTEISLLKSRGVHPDSPAVPERLREIYRLYQDRLAAMGACDYDDLILKALDLLRLDGALLSYARERASHLLVDEFQDVNAVQYHLLRILAEDGADLFVIGDPNQAIYGFRGADHHYFQQLLADFPTAAVHRLTRNYRSAGTVVRLADGIIGSEETETLRRGGQRPRYVGAEGERAEAQAMLREIERLVGGTGMQAADWQSGGGAARHYSLGEIAVLYRTGRQAEALEEALLGAGLPYRVQGRQALLGGEEVREALDLLRYLDRPTDLRFLIALAGGRFNPGAAALRLLRSEAESTGAGMTAAAEALFRSGRFTIEAHARIQAFLDFTADLAAKSAGAKAADLLLQAAPAGADGPLRRLQQLARAAGGLELSEFLLRLSTGQEGDQERREETPGRPGEVVTLMTMHAAKGTEFPAVIITGMADGVIPWRRAESQAELEEERRLLYVAVTRAAEALILIGPPHAGGRKAPSRFLADLAPDLLENVGVKPRRRRLGQQRGLF